MTGLLNISGEGKMYNNNFMPRKHQEYSKKKNMAQILNWQINANNNFVKRKFY